jgi:2Fe-2S ferredoxin
MMAPLSASSLPDPAQKPEALAKVEAMARITFVQPDGSSQVIDVQNGRTIMEAARENGVAGILADCGGACACATCHVYVDAEWVSRLPQAQQLEQDMLEFAHEPDPVRSRLTCQIRVDDGLDGLIVYLPAGQ